MINAIQNWLSDTFTTPIARIPDAGDFPECVRFFWMALPYRGYWPNDILTLLWDATFN
jgi:hypothetical protein